MGWKARMLEGKTLLRIFPEEEGGVVAQREVEHEADVRGYKPSRITLRGDRTQSRRSRVQALPDALR